MTITPADIFEAAKMPREERPIPTDPDELQKMLLEMFIETPQWQEYGVVPGYVLLAPLPSSGMRNNAVRSLNPATVQAHIPPIDTAVAENVTATPHSAAHFAISSTETGHAPPPPAAVQLVGHTEALVPPPSAFHFNLGASTTAVARPPAAKKDILLASRAPRPYMPATVYTNPPPGPSKRTTNLKANYDTGLTEGDAKRVGWTRKVRLPRAHLEALYERSVEANSNNFTCPVIGCGRVSKDTPAHKSHVLSHSIFEYPCSYCTQVLSSEKNQSYHMRVSCKYRPGAKAQ